MKLKEAAGAEVTVELDEDLVGRGRHALLCWAATELANLRRGLVRSIPDTQKHGDAGWCWWCPGDEEEGKERENDLWINSNEKFLGSKGWFIYPQAVGTDSQQSGFL